MQIVLFMGLVCAVAISGAAHAEEADIGNGLEVSIGTVYLKRQSTDGIVMTPPTGTPGTLLTGDNFNFDREFGPDISARWKIDPDWSIEGRYFSSKSDAGYLIPSITTFRTAGIGVTILGGGSIDSSFSSELGSGELSLVRNLVPGVSVLAGFRHLGLDESLRSNIATPITYVSWDEENDLYGGQLGLKLGFQAPSLPLEFNATVKGGGYRNSVSNQFRSTIVGSDATSGSKMAYSGEIDLSATYHLNERFSITAGYSSLWLKNVALGDRQAEATIQVPGGTSSPLAYDDVRYDAFSIGANIDF